MIASLDEKGEAKEADWGFICRRLYYHTSNSRSDFLNMTMPELFEILDGEGFAEELSLKLVGKTGLFGDTVSNAQTSEGETTAEDVDAFFNF